MITAKDIINRLDLKPLPEEGGYYRETYRGNQATLPAIQYGIDSNSKRDVCTAIHYLITKNSFSALHRVKSDEMFHFYSGDPVEMIQLDEKGKLTHYTLGSDVMKGEEPQVVVPRGVWQALRLKDGGEWALMGTTVAPGFEFEDFEVGHREVLLNQYPQHRNDITRFTRDANAKVHE